MRKGALDAAQCRRAFSQVLLRLYPDGAPAIVKSEVLDCAFCELDDDMDGLLTAAEFQVFALRGIGPMLKGHLIQQQRRLNQPRPRPPISNPANALNEATPSATDLNRVSQSAVPKGFKEPGALKSKAVGFSISALIPSTRDLNALLQEYTIPEGDSSLGKGAFGAVLKVTHNRSGEERACKAVALGDGKTEQSQQLRDLVELEIRMLKSLDHLNLLRLHEAFRDGSRCVYIVTELCAGGSLAERLMQQRFQVGAPLSEGQAAAYVEQMLSATSFCHARGVIHRDLKTENVLFMNRRPESPLKVIDFGLSDTMERIRSNCTLELEERKGALGAVARFLPRLPGGLEILSTKVKKEVMQRAGTPHYMAPEVYEGQYDEKSDIWSIGVMLFEMLSNRHPFYTNGNDLDDVKRRILSPSGADFTLDSAWSQVSRDAQRATRAALEKDPRKRPSASALLSNSWLSDVPRLILGQQSQFEMAQGQKSQPGPFQVLESLRHFASPGHRGMSRSRLRQAFLRLLSRELSETQIAHLRGTFLRLDLDGDGMLSAEDLLNSLRQGRQGVDLGDYGADVFHSGRAYEDPAKLMEEWALVGVEGDIRPLLMIAGTAGEALVGFSDFLAIMTPRHVIAKEGQLIDAWRRLDSQNEQRLTKAQLKAMMQVGQAVSAREVEELKEGLPEELTFMTFFELLEVQVSA